MKESNYWQQFLSSGRIEDYLRFRENRKDEDVPEGRPARGDNPYAGLGEINRNGFEDGAYRGIR